VRRACGPIFVLLAAAGCSGNDVPDDAEKSSTRTSSAIVTLDQAELHATIDGRTRPSESITLPLHWDVRFRGGSGRAVVKIAFARPFGSRDSNAPYMLFMTRIANAYSIQLNGVPLASAGDLNANGDRWSAKQPVGVLFPANLLADTNVLSISLRGDGGRRAGVSPIKLGPAHIVEPMRARAFTLRVGLTMAAALFSLLVAAFCLLLWLQQREKLYAWAAIGEAIWAVVVTDVALEWTPLRWPAWGLALLLVRTAWIWALYVIVEQVYGSRPALERRTLKYILAAVPLCIVLAAAVGTPLPLQIWRGTASFFTAVLVVQLFAGLRTAFTVERLLLASGIAVLLLAGAHDAFSSTLFSARYGDSVWAKYVGAVLGMTIMWIVSMRFRQARREAAELHASLAQRVEQKERELRESFARLSEMERAHAVTAERERILRDMHDGVGANLATAMRQLESGGAPASEVAATLRESLDHLKLSIDAMNLPTGDVNALLASLRYRLQPRIESAGLALEWQVDLLPPWPAGTDQAMRHLQFLLLEAISNALQHSHAKTLTLSAHVKETAIELELRDDGQGIGDKRGRGLSSMRERADAIGAKLAIESADPGTRVRVLLPT
jgi:signal transduction histidine kinase